MEELETDAARHRPASNNKVESKILHGRVEHFLHRVMETMDLIDKKDVA
jgi:hypothetical protein